MLTSCPASRSRPWAHPLILVTSIGTLPLRPSTHSRVLVTSKRPCRRRRSTIHNYRGTSLIRNRNPLRPNSSLCLGSWGVLVGAAISHERGTPVNQKPPLRHASEGFTGMKQPPQRPHQGGLREGGDAECETLGGCGFIFLDYTQHPDNSGATPPCLRGGQHEEYKERITTNSLAHKETHTLGPGSCVHHLPAVPRWSWGLGGETSCARCLCTGVPYPERHALSSWTCTPSAGGVGADTHGCTVLGCDAYRQPSRQDRIDGPQTSDLPD